MPRSPLPSTCLLKRFVSDRSGAAALIFGLSLIPIVGLIGAAVDYSRVSDAR